MPLGYTGKILRVDLGNNAITVEEPDEIFYRRYLGGRGLIAYYLLKEVPTDADPLGPENLLIFDSAEAAQAMGFKANHHVAGESGKQ